MAIKTRKQLLAWDLAHNLNDKKHFGWYLKIAKQYPETFLRRILSEIKDIARRKRIKNKGAYFIKVILNRSKKK